jgi:hypothetical protein
VRGEKRDRIFAGIVPHLFFALSEDSAPLSPILPPPPPNVMQLPEDDEETGDQEETAVCDTFGTLGASANHSDQG